MTYAFLFRAAFGPVLLICAIACSADRSMAPLAPPPTISNPGTRAPVAVTDSYSVNQNTPLTVNAPGVLGNDTDADGNTLSAVKLSDPPDGTVVLNANGSFTYTPNVSFVGTDSFTYKANDGTVDSNTATVTITVTTVTAVNNPSVVTVEATDASAAEAGPNTGTFTFRRTGPTTSTLQVNIAVAGTATEAGLTVTPDSDYNRLGPGVTFFAGQSSVTRTVTPILDARLEGDETAVVTLMAGPPGTYGIGTRHEATVTIADNVPVVTVTAPDPAAAEVGPDTGTFTFTRTGDPKVALRVQFTMGGTATPRADYVPILADGQEDDVIAVLFSFGQVSVTRTVTPLPDALPEPGGETVIVRLTNGQYVIGTPAAATVTIADAP